jgi:hypothetical protein
MIVDKLDGLSGEHQIRILMACESGSRAWGFASPDSDYDVRLIYSHSVDWYLALEETRDTIDSLDDATAIDLAGWELRKALRLFAGCNPSLNEWLLSPITYRQEDDFVARLRTLMPLYFNPRRAMHHYLGTARQIMKEHLREDRIGIKKAFYVIRPMAAAAWIRDLQTQPPTDLLTLLAQTPSPELLALQPHIAELITRKASAAEKEPITLPAPIRAFFQEIFPALEGAAKELPSMRRPDFGPLQEVFREYLKA